MIDYKTTPVGDLKAQGLYVAAVSYNDDFQEGDRIIGVNGIMVDTIGQMRDIIGACQEGDAAEVTVVRDDMLMDISVTLTASDTEKTTAEHAA